MDATLAAAVSAVATRRGLIRDSLAEPLVRAAQRWIAEGLLTAALSLGAQQELLDDIFELSAAGSRFAADYGVSSADYEVVDHLRARGWVTVGSALAQLLTAAGLSGSGRDEHTQAPVPTRYVPLCGM